MNDEWRERLTRYGHLERCSSLVDAALEPGPWVLGCYLAGIFTFTDPSDKILPLSPTQERWWTFIRRTWEQAGDDLWRSQVRTLPVLVTVTRQNLPGPNKGDPSIELTNLARDVHRAWESLQDRQAILVDIYRVAQADFDAALSSMHGLDDDLCRMIENASTSQKDDGSLGP
ncbi:hypothetical protein EDB19DRAFT_1792437 [Suillus lakei]|nr:hypothetical protein EDB19DRAFT_1792437 [Suillus lakei]